MNSGKLKKKPVVLSIAGYDPSSGAGITADIKTIAAQGCYGVTCITALTVQSTRGVRQVEAVDPQVIRETLEELAADFVLAAVKIGMLGSAAAASSVAEFLEKHKVRHVVLDPIMRSSSGTDLVSNDGLQILKERLLPQASVITPNIEEAKSLTGLTVSDPATMEAAAKALQRMGARGVIITGGHLKRPMDLVTDRRSKSVLLAGRKIATRSTHGTGCAFSTALACNLAKGKRLVEAARIAKRFVQAAMRNAPAVGKGTGPVL